MLISLVNVSRSACAEKNIDHSISFAAFLRKLCERAAATED